MVIINAIESVLCIIAIIGIGYILTLKGWFNEDISKAFSRLVTNISLPALMISTLLTSFDKQSLIQSSIGLAIPFLSIGICFLLASTISKFVISSRRGIFQTMFVVSNTIFIGLPVNIALFGNKSIPYALLYYIANTTFFWTIGVYLISRDSQQAENSSIISHKALKSILSPPLFSFMAGVLFVLLQIQLPKFIMDTCKYLGNLTTPLSLLFIGITFKSISFKDFKLTLDKFFIFLGRFIVSPLLVFALAFLIPVPALMLKVFIIQSAMPVMAQTAIIAKAYNADYEYATVMITITTVVSLIIIPVYMAVMSVF